VTDPVWEFPLRLPRHAFSARDAARAGDVWRCFQEAAVEASSRAGWPPQRYRTAGTAFVVRSMVVRHQREATYGEQTRGRTWVSRFRRDIFSTREVRLLGEDGATLAEGTQEWAHVSAELAPKRAGPELIAAFPVHDEGRHVTLPDWEELPGATTRFSFHAWYTWMDPLDHVNHPGYVDFCDEAISHVMAPAGLSPVALKPVAERAVFRAGVGAWERVTVESTRVGRTADGDLVLAHRILKEDGTPCADATTVRGLASGDPSPLVAAFDG